MLSYFELGFLLVVDRHFIIAKHCLLLPCVGLILQCEACYFCKVDRCYNRPVVRPQF